MKQLLYLAAITFSFSVQAAPQECKTENKNLPQLIQSEMSLKSKVQQHVQDLLFLNASPREFQARTDVDLRKITALDDQINTIEQRCNGRYDLWNVEGDQQKAQTAAAEEEQTTH